MGEDIWLNPHDIEPLHGARLRRLLDALVTDMEENGWQGRPLLVISRATDYVAWTGSHRVAAARKAGLTSVPCYALEERNLLRHGVDAVYGHVEDWERLEICRKIGDEIAVQIMWQEGRS